jgi:hypothetical protein
VGTKRRASVVTSEKRRSKTYKDGLAASALNNSHGRHKDHALEPLWNSKYGSRTLQLKIPCIEKNVKMMALASYKGILTTSCQLILMPNFSLKHQLPTQTLEGLLRTAGKESLIATEAVEMQAMTSSNIYATEQTRNAW